MVIASGNKRSPRRRAQRGRVVHVVTKAVVRDPLEVRGLDRSAEGAACSEAHVVRKDQQNVRRSAGASTPFAKSGVESLTFGPIFPWKGGSGRGNTLGVSDFAEGENAVAATADAAMTELEPSKRRRLISILPVEDREPDFLSGLSSLMTHPTLFAAKTNVAGR